MKWPALFAWLALVRPKGFLGRQPRGKAPRVRGVCTNPGCLWKGPRGRFFRLYDSELGRFPARLVRSCQKFHKGPACGNKTRGANAIFRRNAMDQPLDKSLGERPASGPQRGLPRHGRAGAGRACTRPGRAARPAGAAAHRRRRQRGALPAGDLGRFRPPLGRRDHHRRDDAGVLRDPACDQAPEELDGAAARGHRAAIPARAQPPDPAAARRRRHHRALELSAPAHACARDRRDRRRQPGHHQAERTLAALLQCC